MNKDEALALALEALESCSGVPHWPALQSTITAIKQARSAPVQKPYRPLQDNGSQYFGDSWDTLPTQSAPVQPVPCCGKYETCTQACTPRGKFLGARDAAAQRQWVGLTDEEFEDIELGCRSTSFGKIEAMRKVEAKLKEKNT